MVNPRDLAGNAKEEEGWADRLASTLRITTSLQLDKRSAERLEELSEHGQTRASQHRSPQGKRSGEKVANIPLSMVRNDQH